MPPRKRKCYTEVRGPKRLTRLQAKKLNTPIPEACLHLPTGSSASPSRFQENANTFPRAAKRTIGREVNEKEENVLIISDGSDNNAIDDEYLNYISSANELCELANLPEELVARSNDSSLPSYSDTDSQSLSESHSDFEAELAVKRKLVTYARRPANNQSNSRARITENADSVATTSKVNGAFEVGNSSNSRIIDDVRRSLDTPFSAVLGENVPVQNVPENGAGNGIGTMPMEEPATASATSVERLLDPSCNLTRTGSFGLTEMIRMRDLERGMDEVQSPAVDTVHGYVVKQKFVSILKLIIDKYGDIVANYGMESIKSRSSSLKAICKIIQSLETKRLNELSLAEITTLLAQVRDFRKIGMRAEWLEKRLEDLEAAKHAIMESSSLNEEKQKNAALLKELMTKLEDERTQLNDVRTQSAILTNSINEQKTKLEFYKAKTRELEENEKSAMEDLKVAQDNARRLNQTTPNLIHKVQFFRAHPLLDDLL